MTQKEEKEARTRFVEWCFREAEESGKGRVTLALECWMIQEKRIIELTKELKRVQKNLTCCLKRSRVSVGENL